MTGRGTGKGAFAVRHYFSESQPLAQEVQHRFEVAFPDYFARYSTAFQAGRWNEDDPGPFLGRAIVWKLQVHAHQDGLDEGPAAIFTCGDFEGGELYFPDIGLKLA